MLYRELIQDIEDDLYDIIADAVYGDVSLDAFLELVHSCWREATETRGEEVEEEWTDLYGES